MLTRMWAATLRVAVPLGACWDPPQTQRRFFSLFDGAEDGNHDALNLELRIFHNPKALWVFITGLLLKHQTSPFWPTGERCMARCVLFVLPSEEAWWGRLRDPSPTMLPPHPTCSPQPISPGLPVPLSSTHQPHTSLPACTSPFTALLPSCLPPLRASQR